MTLKSLLTLMGNTSLLLLKIQVPQPLAFLHYQDFKSLNKIKSQVLANMISILVLVTLLLNLSQLSSLQRPEHTITPIEKPSTYLRMLNVLNLILLIYFK